jgi:signal transduction histidine kinase
MNGMEAFSPSLSYYLTWHPSVQFIGSGVGTDLSIIWESALLFEVEDKPADGGPNCALNPQRMLFLRINSIIDINLIIPEDRKASLERHRKKMAGISVPGLFEMRILRKDNIEACIELTGSSTTYQGEPVDVVYIRDITIRRQAELALKDSEEKYRSLFDDSPISLWEVDNTHLKQYIDNLKAQGITDFDEYFNDNPEDFRRAVRLSKMVRWNQAFLDIFEADNISDLGQKGDENFFEGLGRRGEKVFLEGSHNYVALKNDFVRLANGERSFTKEEAILTAKGNTKYIETNFTIAPNCEDTWSRVFSAFVDITKRKHAEDQLKNSENNLRLLSQRLLTTQEEERTRIARDIHDQLIQELVLIKMMSMSISSKLDVSPLAEKAKQVTELADRLINRTQRISVNLRPDMLDKLGLIKAVQWYVEDFERNSSISCPFDSNLADGADEIIPKNVAIIAYRIIQEALTNVLHHAHAKQAEVDISLKSNILSIKVIDDGIGFETDSLIDNMALGLVGMKERAITIGGVCEIISYSGKGTQVIATLPIP